MLTRNKVAKKLAKRLRQLRESKGLSQEDFAFQSNLGRSYYWRLEQGQINVTLETLVRLSNALHIEIAALFQTAAKK
jgi:transcriptional regulator with XRE-family HTH domain